MVTVTTISLCISRPEGTSLLHITLFKMLLTDKILHKFLQSIWRWLFNSKNTIRSEDRPEMMNRFKRGMYSGNEGETDKAFDDLIEHCNELEYGNFVKWVVVSACSFPC